MIDDSKTIKAQQILEDPEAVYSLTRAYIMLTDTSMTMSFSNLMEAINLMHDAGWEVTQMTSHSGSYMFVMMKNLNYKKKNSGAVDES